MNVESLCSNCGVTGTPGRLWENGWWLYKYSVSSDPDKVREVKRKRRIYAKNNLKPRSYGKVRYQT